MRKKKHKQNAYLSVNLSDKLSGATSQLTAAAGGADA
jgi:hypothetical protein